MHQLPTLYRVSGGFLGALSSGTYSLHHSDVNFCPKSQENSSEALWQRPPSLTSQEMRIARPASPFELSPQFFPEQYTLPNFISQQLILFKTSEFYHTENHRVDRYQLTFAESARQWRKVAVLISIDRQSKFWGLTRVGGSFGDKTSLPGTLKEQLEDLLVNIEFLWGVTGLFVQLADMDEERGPSIDKSSMHVYSDKSEQASSALVVKEFVDNLGCPKFHPREVIVYRYLYRSDTFLVSLHGNMYGEIRLGFGPEALQRQLYQIQLLHCLNGASAITPFIGVITDDRTQELRGFLKELPAQGLMFDIMRQAEQKGLVVPWERRQKWARQIVAGVLQAHSKGFVVGSLGRLLCVGIDRDDNARLDRFRSTIKCHANYQGFLPPELRQHASLDGKTVDVTPGTDLFQLGMLLWRIAAYKTTQGGPSMFCASFGCPYSSTATCRDAHTNPIALPPLGDTIPDFYQKIISICRAERSSQRRPASELLKMFPSNANANLPSEHSALKISGLDEHSTIFYCRVICDFCGKKPLEHYYHCNTCSEGHYDLCPDCVAKGIHCLDETHFLAEKIKRGNEFCGTRRYHSKVTATGERRDTVFQFKAYSSVRSSMIYFSGVMLI